MGRLLTDEEILAIISDNYGAEGEPHPIPVGKIADASQLKTLKAVGEEMEEDGLIAHEIKGYNESGRICEDFCAGCRAVDKLKQGKMPE